MASGNGGVVVARVKTESRDEEIERRHENRDGRTEHRRRKNENEEKNGIQKEKRQRIDPKDSF